MPILNSELKERGIISRSFSLSDNILIALKDENWKLLDTYFLEMSKPTGELYNFLADYLNFDSIEHIIAIREAPNDEDGIWHDDGSRILGFSLSLTNDHEKITGGHLHFRKKGENKDPLQISTRPLGTILLFLTGVYGYEHMVSKVSSGRRIVIAGWCS